MHKVLMVLHDNYTVTKPMKGSPPPSLSLLPNLALFPISANILISQSCFLNGTLAERSDYVPICYQMLCLKLVL